MKTPSMFFLFLSYVIESLMRIRQDMEGSQKYEYEYKSSSLDTVIGGYPFRFWGRFLEVSLFWNGHKVILHYIKDIRCSQFYKSVVMSLI